MSVLVEAVAEAGAGGFGAGHVAGAIDTLKEIVAKSAEFIVPPILLPALIKELYRWAMISENIPNDNLIDPNEGLNAFKAFTATASLLAALGVDEIVEILTEGVGEALSDALRHIVSEPFEKVFSVYRGNREIDEDEIADGYSYGVVGPRTLGAMAIMNGYSSVSTLLLLSKSTGMKYNGDIQEVATVVDALAARAVDTRLDPWELAVSMSRSVVNGIDETVRTEADRIYSELRQIIGRALDRARDAYVNLMKASQLYNTDPVKADGYAGLARGLVEEVNALVETFDKFEQDFAAPVLNDLLDRAEQIIGPAVQRYEEAIHALIRVMAELVKPLTEFVADIGVIAYQEIRDAVSEIAQYRRYVPEVPPASKEWTGPAGSGVVLINVKSII